MIWCYPILWSVTHFMPYWGIFPFWLRFTDLHVATWSLPLSWYILRRWPACCLFMISQGSLSRAIRSGSDLLAFRCRHTFSSGYVSMDAWVWFSCRSGLWRSYIRWWMIWGHSIFWSTMHLRHTEAYFCFGWDLQILAESRDRPHLWDTCRARTCSSFYRDLLV